MGQEYDQNIGNDPYRNMDADASGQPMSDDKCPECGGPVIHRPDVNLHGKPGPGRYVSTAAEQLECKQRQIDILRNTLEVESKLLADKERELGDQMRVNADFNTECVAMDKQLTAAEAVVEALRQAWHKLQGGGGDE